MKYIVEQIPDGEDELILRYQKLTQEVESILNFINSAQRKLVGLKDGTQIIIDVRISRAWTGKPLYTRQRMFVRSNSR